MSLVDYRPNLFDFATSELSQDAFLCWLIDHARFPGRGALHACAREFIALLYIEANPGQAVSGADVVLEEKPRRQVEHIDILFKAKVAGRLVHFVIEDKVHTSEHSDQLKRADLVLERMGVSEGDRVRIYLKTGYLFGQDYKVSRHRYVVFGPQALLHLLTQYDPESDIFRDFRDRLERRVNETEAGLSNLLGHEGSMALKSDHVQWGFMERLFPRLSDDSAAGELRNGYKRDGSPYTQFCFIKLEGVLPDGIREDVFYRLDGRKNPTTEEWGYYLAARQHAGVEDSPEARQVKLQRLERYRHAFAEALLECGSTLVSSRPTTDNRGAKESEIGTVFFGAATNKVADVLREWPAFHRAFLARLRIEGLIPADYSPTSEELAAQR
ncbi:MAG: hypothetical protein VKS61_00205 [Candidatus Sericytochromatia bacterium]|nr:hypothetical protein [Candidatus Sericytochromatia bacterium]